MVVELLLLSVNRSSQIVSTSPAPAPAPVIQKAHISVSCLTC